MDIGGAERFGESQWSLTFEVRKRYSTTRPP